MIDKIISTIIVIHLLIASIVKFLSTWELFWGVVPQKPIILIGPINRAVKSNKNSKNHLVAYLIEVVFVPVIKSPTHDFWYFFCQNTALPNKNSRQIWFHESLSLGNDSVPSLAFNVHPRIFPVEFHLWFYEFTRANFTRFSYDFSLFLDFRLTSAWPWCQSGGRGTREGFSLRSCFAVVAFGFSVLVFSVIIGSMKSSSSIFEAWKNANIIFHPCQKWIFITQNYFVEMIVFVVSI